MHTTPKSITSAFTRLIPAGLLIAAFNSPTAWGQETVEESSEEVYVLEDFVVTEQYLYTDQINALKSPTPIIDVPQSLSITTAQQIQDQGFDSIGDIVNYTPGVNNAQGEGHRDAVVFRGSRSTGSFFVDGVRDDVEHYRPLYNVEQLEILRGPNALLFGRGGTGGVINRVMKKGVIGSDFTEYQFSIDTFGAYSPQIDSNFALGESAAFRINAFYEDIQNHRDPVDGDRFGFNPTVKFKLGEATTLDLSYEYSDHDHFIDRGIPTGADGEPVGSLDDIYFGDEDISRSTFEAHVFRAALQHRFSDELKLRLDAAYGDYDKAYENFYATGYDPVNEEVDLSGYEDSTHRENLTLAAGLITEFETGNIAHTLVGGVEYIDSDNDNARLRATPGNLTDIDLDDLDSFNGSFSVFGDDTAAELNVVSLYIQDEIALSEHFDLILGARYDRFDFEVDVFDENGNLDANRTQVDEELTPRLGFIFKPKENVSLYLSYSQTFLPKSGEQFATVSGDNASLDPDEFVNLEAGLKWDVNERLSLTAAIFNLEQDATEGDGNGNYASVESEVSGFEAQLLSRVTDAWSLTAGYSYLDGEVRNEDNDGNRPRELPEHSFSVWNRYDLTERFSLGLGAIYQDDTYITENNDTELPGFFRVDAAAYYVINENLRLQVNIENLLDEEYYPHAHGDHQATVGAPIHARFALTGRF